MKQALIKLHIAVFLAGFTGILGRLITLNEGLLVWYRLFITIVTMWLLFSFTKKLTRISKKDMIQLAGVGFLAALHWVTFYGSIKYANVSVALVCFSAVGFFTAFLEPLIVHRKIIWTEVLLGFMVMIGIYIIFHFDPHYKTGIILGINSALLIALAMILLRQFVQRINGETALTYQLTGGLFLLTLVMPFYLYLFPVKTLLPTIGDWGWLLVLSWLCSVWAFQLTAQALKKLSAFTVNLTFNLEPVYGIVMAFIFFNEAKDLNKGFYFGLALIILSVVLQMWRVIKLKKH